MLNNSVNGHNRKAPRYAEIFKLAAKLAERDISFELKHIVVGDFKKVYLYYPAHYVLFTPADMVVTQGDDTAGLALEIEGWQYDEVENRNIRYYVGGLTAKNVLERILKKEAEKC